MNEKSSSQQQTKDALDNDSRDIVPIWNDAVRKYKGITGLTLQPEFESIKDMVRFGSDQMNAFHKYRHDQRKVDKLRSLFIDSMEYIEVGSQHLVAAATAAFPPSAGIGLALTFMLKACRQVSADYDVVIAFFEDMNAFLQRINILQSRLPDYPAYRNCLMDVFTSFLTMCAVATRYIELGRFKKWIIGAIKLGAEDAELVDARKAMDGAMSYLQSATEFAILGNTEKLQSMNTDLKLNSKLQTEIMESQSKMLETVLGTTQEMRNDLQKLLLLYERKPHEDAAQWRQPLSRKRPPTWNRVHAFFGDRILDPRLEYENIKFTIVPETGQWPFRDAAWVKWSSQTSDSPTQNISKILAIVGSSGTGKSHLTVSAYDHLMELAERDADTELCVAHYYFRGSIRGLDQLDPAVDQISIQIAEQSASLCEKLNVEMERDEYTKDTTGWKAQDWWKTLIKPLFSASSRNRLYVVWDGLDELNEQEQNKAQDFLKFIQFEDDSNVRFLCTTRPATFVDLETIGAVTIHATSEKQTQDLKALVWNRLDNDSALRKLSRYMKQRIASTLERDAQNILYAEYMLQRFSATRREPLVLRTLNNGMPPTILDLYEGMLAELQSHLRQDQQLGARILLCWVAYSSRLLTVDEHIALLKILSGTAFDLERDLQDPYLAKFLKISDFQYRPRPSSLQIDELDLERLRNSDALYQDGDLPITYQARSMQDFFRSAEPGETSLRTPVAEAQRHLFLFCARTICGVTNIDQPGLVQYAAGQWLKHLEDLYKAGFEEMPKDDQITVIEAISAILNDQPKAASAIQKLSDDDFEVWSHLEDSLATLTNIARIARFHEQSVNEPTRMWAESVTKDARTAYIPLAKGHVMNWFRAEDVKMMARSYRFARAVLQSTNLSYLVQEPSKEGGNADEEWRFRKEEIMTIFEIFVDIPKSAEAHRAVAGILQQSRYPENALQHIQTAIKLAPNESFALQAKLFAARLEVELESWDKALDVIVPAMDLAEHMPPDLLRQYLTVKARAESGAKKYELAIKSYKAARKADPQATTLGEILNEEFNTIRKHRDAADAVNVLKDWKVIERLAWLTWDYDADADHHWYLHRAASKCGQQDFLVQVYEEAITTLDKLKASVPMKYQLALVHWRGRGDIEAAKSLLIEILDTPSQGDPYPLTDEEPEYALEHAMDVTTSIIHEQYRDATDPDLKMSLYKEMKELMNKEMTSSVTFGLSGRLYSLFIQAKVARKMVGAHEYYKICQEVIKASCEALSDSVGWNDLQTLFIFASVLSQMNGLHEDARIAISCIFSQLDRELDYFSDSEEEEGEQEGTQDQEKEERSDNAATQDVEANNVARGNGNVDQDFKERPKNSQTGSSNHPENDDSGDPEMEVKEEGNNSYGSDDDSETDSLPSNEGDLSRTWYLCDGECDPCVQWRAWKGRPMYKCILCPDTVLCTACYEKRIAYNEGAPNTLGTEYCGKNHQYVKGPIEGWRGITDGVIYIDRREPIAFPAWLADLRDRKIKEAWERFWLEEV